MTISFNGTGISPPNVAAPVSPWITTTYGQSDTTNTYPNFALYSLPYQAVLAAKVSVVGGLITGPGPLGNGANLRAGSVIGWTNYAPTDVISVGRCAVIAQQLFRAQRNPGQAVIPILEFCQGSAASSWTDGPSGGLGPGVTFTGVIVNDVLTASNLISATGGGVITANQHLVAAGVDPITIITADTGGNQGAGTYTVGRVQFVTDGTTFSSAHATFTGAINAGNAAPGNIVTVDVVLTGTVTPGDTITGGTTLANTVLGSQISGTTGGAGTYNSTIGSPQNVSSETMTVYGDAWHDQSLVLGSLTSGYPILPSNNLLAPIFKSVRYLQNTSTRFGVPADVGKLLDLTDMLQLYDSLNLLGAGTTNMIYEFNLPGSLSNAIIYDIGENALQTFCKTNAPGQGGPWSGRCFAAVPVFSWPWIGTSNIHLNQYGQIRAGEWWGYVGHQVEDLGNLNWTPLWRPITGGAITMSGNAITIPWARPSCPDFAATPLVMRSDPNDGIKVWPNNGFHVFNGAADLAVASVVISGLNVIVTLAVPQTPGTVLEVSYAWHGPGGPNPGFCSGVGGNLCMRLMGASVLVPGESIDAWAWPFIENITVP